MSCSFHREENLDAGPGAWGGCDGCGAAVRVGCLGVVQFVIAMRLCCNKSVGYIKVVVFGLLTASLCVCVGAVHEVKKGVAPLAGARYVHACRVEVEMKVGRLAADGLDVACEGDSASTGSVGKVGRSSRVSCLDEEQGGTKARRIYPVFSILPWIEYGVEVGGFGLGLMCCVALERPLWCSGGCGTLLSCVWLYGCYTGIRD
ncbi:hypothetical protein QBC34DRAFT_393347, partial [Podospora aff. communis PSN243]